jgi:hypothetical protein
MRKLLFFTALVFTTTYASIGYGQKIDLKSLYKSGKLIIYPNNHVAPLNESNNGLSQDHIVWLKDFTFSTGTIDVDLRGKDVFQQSFIGIAFHGIDTVTYDAVYFRPFNFQSPDTLRKKHTVQYISEPDYPWERLRSEHPLVYENAVNPFPMPKDWFHARIVVSKDSITVYVNHSVKVSLKVKKLNKRTDGLLGLWNFALDGDYANLVVKKY